MVPRSANELLAFVGLSLTIYLGSVNTTHVWPVHVWPVCSGLREDLPSFMQSGAVLHLLPYHVEYLI